MNAAQTDNTATLYDAIADLPIVSPHGHCEPSWFATNAAFSNPAELLITRDHYVFRMLYSQGISMADLGVGMPRSQADPRKVFHLLANNWHLFLGTPSHGWLNHTFRTVFGLNDKLSPNTANHFYDHIADCLTKDAFRPRALFDRFNIAALATTDGALDPLSHHQTIAASGWSGRIIPTFRPDSLLNPAHPDFVRDLSRLADMTDTDTGNFAGYLQALRLRRAAFRAMGATSTDHGVTHLTTDWLAPEEAGRLFKEAQKGTLTSAEADRFHGHMLVEMAQMSADDGMVMQIHAGAMRNTNRAVLVDFGIDKGADIPMATDWVRGLDGLLNRVGNAKGLSVIAFTLDESTYARELAPMAGHWPALKIGPPWWFHDSPRGIARYFDQVVETAGYWNLAGFNDDTRAFPSIPARHNVWRQGVAEHLSTQIARGVMDLDDARHIARYLAHDAAWNTYKLGAA